MRKNIFLVVALIVSITTCSQTGGSRTQPQGGNQEAMEIKQSIFFADGTLDEYIVSQWNSSYTRVDNQVRYSASGAMIERIEYNYDDKGNVTTKITRGAENSLKNKVAYRYNPQGYLSLETLEDNRGKTVSTQEYSYDSKGNRIGRVIKNGAGSTLAETTYTYDNQNRVTTAGTKDSAGSLYSSTQYSYDEQGNLVRQVTLNGEGNPTAVINAVWQGGREVKNEVLSASGAVQTRVTSEYGGNGELIKKTVENVQGDSKQFVQYEYMIRSVRR